MDIVQQLIVQQVNILAAYVNDLLDDDVYDDDDDNHNSWVKITVDIQEYLHMEDPSFKRHFRFDRTLFERLSEELGQHLVDQGVIRRYRAEFDKHLLMTLWIMATPDSFRSVALRFFVYPNEVHENYAKIIKGLREIGARYVTWPGAEERRQIAANLQRASNGFPGAVGMIDGKHFVISKPLNEPAAYRNRHFNYSILAQAICDHRLLIRDLYVGEVGSLHDARVFRRSPVGNAILTRPNQLFSANEHIIGDSAYPLTDRVMTPFVNNGRLNDEQRNFNRKLCSIRVRIEQAFGRVTTLWRRVRHQLEVRDQGIAVDHVIGDFVLHNFRIIHGGDVPLFADGEAENQRILENEVRVLGDANLPHMRPNEDDDEDPFIPRGLNAKLRQAQVLGEEKRMDICYNL